MSTDFEYEEHDVCSVHNELIIRSVYREDDVTHYGTWVCSSCFDEAVPSLDGVSLLRLRMSSVITHISVQSAQNRELGASESRLLAFTVGQEERERLVGAERLEYERVQRDFPGMLAPKPVTS